MDWDASLLQQLAADPEIDLVMHRDGHPDLRLPVWVVVVDGQAYVRSWKGRGSVWFRRALADADQAIEVRGTTIVARFVVIGQQLRDPIDAAYRSKYASFEYADAMTIDLAAETTIRLEPLG